LNIFIYGYYGYDNTGDSAMLYALLRELPLLYPSADFIVLSRKAMQVPAVAEGRVRFVNRSIPLVIFWLLRTSLFIVGGGSHFCDYGTKKRNLWILIRLWLLFLLARLTGNRIYLINNGVGPLTTKWGRVLAKSMLHMAEKISVREEDSCETLSALGLNSAKLGFDLAALLDTTSPIAPRQNVLGVSISPAFEIYEGDKQKDLLLIDRIARAIKQNPEWKIWLFTFKGKSIFDDVSAMMELKSRLWPLGVRVIPYDSDPRQFLDKVGQCNAFIGMRYHACLYAYLRGIPLLVINYHPKCRALAEDIGLPKEAVINLNEIIGGQLPKRLKHLMYYPGRFRASLPLEKAKSRAMEGIK